MSIFKSNHYKILMGMDVSEEFKRKEYKSILLSQTYLDLCAKVDEKTNRLKSIARESNDLKRQRSKSKKAFEAAKNELSRIAIEIAISEAENQEIDEKMQEDYSHAKQLYVTAKKEYETIKTKPMPAKSLKEKAEKELELAEAERVTFLCANESLLIQEKTELQDEIEEAWNVYGFRNSVIKSIQQDLEKVLKALSAICEHGHHQYKKIACVAGVYEAFECKRCNDRYTHGLPAVWADK